LVLSLYHSPLFCSNLIEQNFINPIPRRVLLPKDLYPLLLAKGKGRDFKKRGLKPPLKPQLFSESKRKTKPLSKIFPLLLLPIGKIIS
jgi:hypothetical protein